MSATDKAISELTAAAALASTDTFAVVQAGSTVKATLAQVLTLIQAGLNGLTMTGTLAMGGNAITGTGAITPNVNDGGALGSATLSYSDLFLATGGVITIGGLTGVVKGGGTGQILFGNTLQLTGNTIEVNEDLNVLRNAVVAYGLTSTNGPITSPIFQVGTNPGTTGSIRVLHDFKLVGRNNANSSDRVHIDAASVVDQLILGGAGNDSVRIRSSSLATPGTLADGDWWVDVIGVSPTRVAAIKVRDGGVTKTIASITY